MSLNVMTMLTFTGGIDAIYLYMAMAFNILIISMLLRFWEVGIFDGHARGDP
jgi:hypothetical protein